MYNRIFGPPESGYSDHFTKAILITLEDCDKKKIQEWRSMLTWDMLYQKPTDQFTTQSIGIQAHELRLPHKTPGNTAHQII